MRKADGSIYLSAFAYDVGDAMPIAALSATSDRREFVETLLANGLRHYRVSTESALELAVKAFAKTLAIWGGDPAKIDLVLFSSESLTQDDLMTPQFARLCDEQGLKDIPVMGLSLHACAGFTGAVRIARALLLSEGLSHVAIVVADKSSLDADRIAPWGITVFSDGAASCIVSAVAAPSGVRVLGIGHAASQRLRAADPDGARSRLLLMMANGVRRATKFAFADADLAPNAVSSLVGTTSRRDSMVFYAKLCGLAPDRVFTETLADISHAFSADIIINLAESAAWRAGLEDAAGRPFLALAQGPHTWGALILQDVADTA